MDLKENICKCINEWLSTHKEYTTRAFAKEFGVTDSSVNRWRNGICAPELSLLPKIAQVMNISIPTLLGLDLSSMLTSNENNLLVKYQTNQDFKNFIDKYLNDEEFNKLINSIAKLSK